MHRGCTLVPEGAVAPPCSAEPVLAMSFPAVPLSVVPLSVERWQRGEDVLRRFGGMLGVGDCSHDDYSRCTGIHHLVDVTEVDTADREPGERAVARPSLLARVSHEFEADRGAAGFGRSGPDRTDAEVVQSVGGQSGIDLPRAVTGQADRCRRIDKVSGRSEGQIELPDVEHRGLRQHRDVRPIVHRPEPTVAVSHRSKRLEQLEFPRCFDVLIAQLDDVDTATESGIQKVSEVPLLRSGVRAQVEAGMIEMHSINATGDRLGSIL